MAVPPDDLFRKQEREAAKFADNRVAQLLANLEMARKDLLLRVQDFAPEQFTANRLAVIGQQIDSVSRELRQNINRIGPSSQPLSLLVQQHLSDSIGIFIAADQLNIDLLDRFSRAELNKISTLAQSEIETVKSLLFSQVGIQGKNPRQVARQLVGKDGRFTGRYGLMQTIMRTESSTIYNAQALEGIKIANQQPGLSFNKRIVETIDSVRNHPISQVLNGMVQEPGKQFRVKVSAVEAKAAELGRSASGVFWPIKDGYYIGQSLPAHYNERGIVVPTKQPVTKKKP